MQATALSEVRVGFAREPMLGISPETVGSPFGRGARAALHIRVLALSQTRARVFHLILATTLLGGCVVQLSAEPATGPALARPW